MGIRAQILLETLSWDKKLTTKFRHHSSKFSDAWDWCDQNCEGKWYSGAPNPVYFQFEKSNDAIVLYTFIHFV